MNRLCFITLATIGLLPVDLAQGHGNAIRVVNNSGTLAVSNGLADAAGYAGQIFVEANSDGDPQFPIVVPYSPCASCWVWNVPGFEISGLAEHSHLRIEPLARPVAGANPAEDRVLWYWNPQSSAIELAPAATTMYLRATGGQSRQLTSSTLVAPAALEIAAPLASDQGFHHHGLLGFALSAGAPAGAYGFFARMTSLTYAPSEPFLVVINHIDHLSDSPDYAQIFPAAQAINAAAVAATPLHGDYNNDGVVDAADYTVWRNHFGEPTEANIHFNGDGNGGVDLADYTWWKERYGNLSAAGGSLAHAVPEPSEIQLFAGTFLMLLLLTSLRIRGTVPAKGRQKAVHVPMPLALLRGNLQRNSLDSSLSRIWCVSTHQRRDSVAGVLAM